MLASRDRSLQVSTRIMNADSVTQLGSIFNHRISLQSSKVMTLAFYAGGIYVISLAKNSKGDNPFLMLWFLFARDVSIFKVYATTFDLFRVRKNSLNYNWKLIIIIIMTPKNYIIERGKISFQGKMLLFSVIFATGKRQILGRTKMPLECIFYSTWSKQVNMKWDLSVPSWTTNVVKLKKDLCKVMR